MIKKTHYINSIQLFLIVLFLSDTLYAFESIRKIPSRNKYFVGRTLYLNSIQEKISQYGKVYLIGHGGVGKTQIAKEFSHINEKKYDLIWWFDLKDDLVTQYESLLAHLSNSKKFKKLLHVKPTDIAPSAIIGFTNSLLEKSNHKWLLIFDNIVDNRKIIFPETEGPNKHIIITTRKKQVFGDNILSIKSFDDWEAEQFLSKIHPKESKKDIIELHKALHNYPLALAQISEEILINRESIKGYLKKREMFAKDKTRLASVSSNIAQWYTSNYYEVLSNTLQDLEHRDKEAAKVLYILALLRANITKKTFNDLFGYKLDNKLAILNNHGMIQMTSDGQTTLLEVHDVIRDWATKRFNNKGTRYKKSVMGFLSNHLSDFYSADNLRYLNSFSPTNNKIVPLYAFIKKALQDNFINEKIINLLIIALRQNDVLFNRHGDYALYQELANKIYKLDLSNLSSFNKALLYGSLMYSDFIFESEKALAKFESEIFHLLDLIKNNQNNEELLFIYARLTMFYIMLGNLGKGEKCLNMAKKIQDRINSDFSLLQYWFSYAWLYYELGRIDEGARALNVYEKIVSGFPPDKINKLSSQVLTLMFKTHSKQKDSTEREIEDAIKYARTYYNNPDASPIGSLESIRASLYFRNKQYDRAFIHINRALHILNKDPGDMKSTHHGKIYLMLGKIYERRGDNKQALEKYKKCQKYYDRHSHGRVLDVYGYGDFLSTLTMFYYKQKNYVGSKLCLQKLVANFGSDHKFVENLIKEFPIEYMYQVSSTKK